MSMQAWFTEGELKEMTTPMLDRIIAAIDAKEYENAKALCEEMKREWPPLYDRLVHMISSLLTFIGDHYGEVQVYEALRWSGEKARRSFEALVGSVADQTNRRQLAQNLARRIRAHCGAGIEQDPARFIMQEDSEKITIILHPCASGHRVWRRGDEDIGVTEMAYPWSFGIKGLPYYCCHCAVHAQMLPIERQGHPLWVYEPPKTPQEPCIRYLYKDPLAIPEHYYQRFGFEKKLPSGGVG